MKGQLRRHMFSVVRSQVKFCMFKGRVMTHAEAKEMGTLKRQVCLIFITGGQVMGAWQVLLEKEYPTSSGRCIHLRIDICERKATEKFIGS